MNRFFLVSLCSILACMPAFAKHSGKGKARPTPVPAATQEVAPAPAPAPAPAESPASARGMSFGFICMEVAVDEGAQEEGVPAEPTAYDRSCTFHSMDRAELEVPGDSANEDEHHMRVFTYTKTGPDTAVVQCKESLVFDDGGEVQGAAMEITLTFTSGNGGTAVFTTRGSHGKGEFTLQH